MKRKNYIFVLSFKQRVLLKYTQTITLMNAEKYSTVTQQNIL